MKEKLPFSYMEEISDQALIDALKTKGAEDPKTYLPLQKWMEQEEKKVVTPEDLINFNRKIARLCIEAGYVQEGLEMLKHVRMQAYNERREELYNKIIAEMNEIEIKYSNFDNTTEE